jgi:hypothetical protein
MGRPVVEFENATTATINVAYMRADDDCGAYCGDPWIVRGWVVLPPGQTARRANPTRNRWFYYYAESVNGAVWSGPYVAEVNGYESFNKCTCAKVVMDPGNMWYDVGFRELDTDTWSGVRFII